MNGSRANSNLADDHGMSATRTDTTLSFLAIFVLSIAPSVEARDVRVFECGTVFGPDTTPASLAAVFGEANVNTTDVHLGEGLSEEATVIFNDTEERIEVLWKKPELRRYPRVVRLRGKRSSWETTHGLKLGLDLRAIEAINGRPFRLLGFAWDYSGTVDSWEDGRLKEPHGAPCRVSARLSPDYSSHDWELIRNVTGGDNFSSQHPTMQLLNPTIYELLLLFP